eukprot:366260-Chlamydomonas_euryale.AAC.16
MVEQYVYCFWQITFAAQTSVEQITPALPWSVAASFAHQPPSAAEAPKYLDQQKTVRGVHTDQATPADHLAQSSRAPAGMHRASIAVNARRCCDVVIITHIPRVVRCHPDRQAGN